METKKIIRGITLLVLAGLVIGGLLMVVRFIQQVIHQKTSPTSHKQGSLLLWNMTDQPIEVSVRPKSKRPLELTIASGARGCFTLQEDEGELIPLRHISIYYRNKRYKFIDPEVLNSNFDTIKLAGAKKDLTPFGNLGIRYLAVSLMDESDSSWKQLKERFGDKLKERNRYVLLTNYAKLTHPFDPTALLQIVRY